MGGVKTKRNEGVWGKKRNQMKKLLWTKKLFVAMVEHLSLTV